MRCKGYYCDKESLILYTCRVLSNDTAITWSQWEVTRDGVRGGEGGGRGQTLAGQSGIQISLGGTSGGAASATQ